MLEWLIVGGGIQGCTMAAYLLKGKVAEINNIAIIDPHEFPLARWKECTSGIDMKYLRSPSIHHLDPSPFALEHFSKKYCHGKQNEFLGPYDRPSLALFNTHCEHIFMEMSLNKCWLKGRVKSLIKKRTYWRIVTEENAVIDSKRVVIAIGVGEQPLWPDWAQKLKERQGNIFHIFSKNPTQMENNDQIVIVGGGITAAHAAIKWGNLFPGQVKLLTRHPIRVHSFDAHPGWLGPKLMRDFSKISSYDERRAVIRQARYRGSMPAELKINLMKAEKEGKIAIVVDEVQDSSVTGRVSTLYLKNTAIYAEQVLLATGFEQTAPGMDWLEATVATERLRCANCGYPIVGPTLEWQQGLYVLGALAELEVGPVARNISGARRGSERIVSSL